MPRSWPKFLKKRGVGMDTFFVPRDVDMDMDTRIFEIRGMDMDVDTNHGHDQPTQIPIGSNGHQTQLNILFA